MAGSESRYTDTQMLDFLGTWLNSRDIRKACSARMSQQTIANTPAAGRSTATGTRKKTRAKVRRTQTAGATG